jgi:uncharacterized protein (TIGR04222 family)
MLDPFDLRGPEFLLFYVCLGALVTIAAVWVRRSREQSNEAPRPLSDYLAIAFLRGGAAEAIRVAILTLLDRGVLMLTSADAVQLEPVGATSHIVRPTERAIIARAREAATPGQLLADREVTAAATAECEPELVRLGLLPSAEQKASRIRLWLLSGGALEIVAGIKILVALARGRSNIQLLVILGLGLLVITYKTTHPRLTSAGSALLGDMRTLFSGLKDRANQLRPQQNANDIALLAAIYGVTAALPVYPELERIFPPPSQGGGGSSDSSGGSSCGSSCGGGGGGCGGCGS